MLWWWQTQSKFHQRAQQASEKWSRTRTRPLSVSTEVHVNLRTPYVFYWIGASIFLPEWISWYSSNICWNVCWTLNARMVLRPWRVEERWEKTGLRASNNHTGHIISFHHCIYCIQYIEYSQSVMNYSGNHVWIMMRCDFVQIDKAIL